MLNVVVSAYEFITEQVNTCVQIKLSNFRPLVSNLISKGMIIQTWLSLPPSVPCFFFFFNLIFKLYIIVLVLPYINMNPPQVYMCSPSWTLLPPPSPYHPYGSSQCTSPKHPVSCIEPGLATHFIYDIIHFNAILPNHPTLSLSHRVQKTVLYISVSFAVSYIGLLLPSF